MVSRSLFLFAFLATVVLGGPLFGGSTLQVTSGGANSGTYKATLDVAKTCTAGDVTVPDGPLTGPTTEEACGVLTANDVDVDTSGGDVVLGGGTRVELGSGFSVAPGTNLFSVEAGSPVLGEAFVRDESPASETRYDVRFYVNPDGLALTQDADQFDHFFAYDVAGNPEFLIGLTRNTSLGENRLFVTAYEDGGGTQTTKAACELVFPTSGWHFVEASWVAASGAGNDDGDIEVCVDDSPGVGGAGMCQSLTDCIASGLDNDTGEISAVEWGSRNVADGDFGSLLLDDFRSQRSGPIGGI